ncbi:UMP kinase [Patescibacteria group bacterium]|nr:UMP kinase [Patescibacteria group bacterium]MBU1951875.1 UMP kinase [Patescibacteria group bacterium]MBU2235739.1 UMP kinase [Patescibacteria group bacterium]
MTGKQKIILSLGGSIIVPDEVNTTFLKKFREVIVGSLNKYSKVVIVAGGGKVCRKYNAAAEKVAKVSTEDLDWIGIATTKLNAELIRVMFGKLAYEKVASNPHKKINTNKKIIIGSGHVPGSSSDLDAVILAQQYGAKTVINLSNISHVYDMDPRKHKNAKRIGVMTWKEFKQVIGDKFAPGMNAPFDPVAAKRAEKAGIRVIVMKGTNIANFKRFLQGKPFSGTVIG